MPPRRGSRKTRKTRRRRSTALNVVNAAQTYLQTAIVTRAAFNVSPIEFLTGQQEFTKQTSSINPVSGVKQYMTTTSTGYFPNTNGTQITLPELFGLDSASDGTVPFGGSGGFMPSVRANIQLNGGYVKPIMQTVVLNAGFAVGKRVFSKQLGLVRKGLKLGGLDKLVKV
jgi:hypothetical protein